MCRHLADHEQPVQEEGLRHFWSAARSGSAGFWKTLWQKRGQHWPADRRLVEYVRIDRGRES